MGAGPKRNAFFIDTLPKLVVGITFILINITLFLYNFFTYRTGSRFTQTLTVLDDFGLPVARGAALSLNFSCAMILLPVCRNILSYIRGCFKGKAARFLDENIAFHIMIGWTIVVLVVVHIIGHMLNVMKLADVDEERAQAQIDAWKNDSDDLDDLNAPIRGPELVLGKNPIVILFSIPAGYTGLIITMSLFLMFTSALESVRRLHFEVFWYTHHLFMVFFAALIAHGTWGFVRSNIDQNSSAIPNFQPPGAQTWIFVSPGLVLYFFERVLRAARAQFRTVSIHKIVQHPSDVVEVQMKGNVRTEPGQYVFVNCPKVAYFEWHPFTLTSSPEEEFFSVHIRCVGDWTNAFAKALGCDFKGKGTGDIQKPALLPSIHIDGPFGTPSVDALKYEVAMFVGGGIGVTPFASLLKSIWYRMRNNEQVKLRKILFVWTSRDRNAFEWFASLLDALEKEMNERGFYDFLSVQIYLTGKLDYEDTAAVVMNDEEQADAITGLQSKTNFGRPRWEQIFEELSRQNPGIAIGVFLCGPQAIAKVLDKNCKKYTIEGGTRFYFNAEHF